MKHYRVVIAAAAETKIREQARYIAVVGESPLNAARWLERVIDAVHSLEHLPRRCPEVAESSLRSFEIRAMNVGGYLLLFTVDDKAQVMTVIGARHGRQLPDPEGTPENPGGEGPGT